MDKFKVIVTTPSFDSKSNDSTKLLEENGCYVVRVNPNEKEQFLKEISDADAIIASLETYDEEIFSHSKKLKILSRYGVGYDKVDIEAATRHNVIVSITPGANANSVADLAVALMLSSARHVSYMDKCLKDKNKKRVSGFEMWEKTLGIIGAGKIGKGVAKRCSGFNMKILCYDKYQDEDFKKELGAEYVDLETLLKYSDFISVHSPLTPETKDMIGENEFKIMKNTAVIVNTARGGIINEDALYNALKDGQIAAAGLDATVEEPPYNSPLLTLSNCTLTPHMGAGTTEASKKMSYMAAENVVEVIKTGTCKNKVN